MCDPSFVEDDYGLLLDDEPFQDNDEDEDFEPVAVVSKSSKSKKKSKPRASSLPGKANKNKKRGRNAKQNFEDSQHFPRQGHYSSPKEENLSPLDSSVANSPASSPPSDDSPELLPKRKREIQTTTKRGKKRTRRGNDEQAEALLLADEEEEEAFNAEQQFNSNWRPRRDRRQTQRLGNELFQEFSECTDETVHREDVISAQRQLSSDLVQVRSANQPVAATRNKAVAINRLPIILSKVLRSLPNSERNDYDALELQKLIISCTLQPDCFPDEASICQFVLQKLKTENRFKYVATEGCSFREVMQRYEEWLNSPKQLKSRSYRMEGITDLANVWTEERIEKFKIAFKKYGYGPTSNRKIAEYIGEDIHPNHVAYYKHRYKKRLIKEGRFEELECVAGIKVHKIKKLKERYQEQQSREGKAKETLKKNQQ